MVVTRIRMTGEGKKDNQIVGWMAQWVAQCVWGGGT